MVRLTDKPQIVIHQSSYGKYVRGIHPGAHNLEPDLIVLLDHHVLVSCLVARRIGVGVEAHVCWNTVSGDETGEGTNLCEQSNLVHLSHYCVQHFSLERSEDNCFVLDRIEDESLARLYESCTNT